MSNWPFMVTTMKSYKFYNQYRVMLYQGEHASEAQAWDAFFAHCGYPTDKRNIQEEQAQGIYWEIAQ